MKKALRPDAQAFDEIIIKTIPRFKTSGLSGDEWRISASVEFFRKGKKQYEFHCRDVEAATVLLPAEYLRAIDEGKAFFAGEPGLCDQEGCSNPRTVVYKLKKKYCREGHSTEAIETFREFCSVHKVRGDCGLEDADNNYELVFDGDI